MMGMELLVAVRERLPIVFAVFNDGRYNMVHHGHRTLFGHEARFDAPWVDFALWARSMGMVGLRVDRSDDLTPERLATATESGGPVVLDVRIDPEVRLRGAGRLESLQHMSAASPGAAL